MELIDKFKNLPHELVNIIINYTDVLVYRYGKYINRINKTDNRYTLVNKIPRPIYVGSYKILLHLTDVYYKGYFLKYDMSDNVIKINVKFIFREKEKNGGNKCYEIKSNNTYILDPNNKWSKIIKYIM